MFLDYTFLLARIKEADGRIFAKIISCYVLSAWLFVLSFKMTSVILFSILILIEIVLHRYTWHYLSLVSRKLGDVKVVIRQSFS